MKGRQVHRMGTYVLSLAMLVIGLALIIQVAAGNGGGALSARLLLGVLFVAGGAGRTYIEIRRGRGA